MMDLIPIKLPVSELGEIETFINLISSYAITSTIIAFSNVNIEKFFKDRLLI